MQRPAGVADEVDRLAADAGFSGVVPDGYVRDMVRSRTDGADGSTSYGLGFWLARPTGAVMLEGYDAGVSFQSVHDPARRVTQATIADTSDGAWPITRRVAERLSPG